MREIWQTINLAGHGVIEAHAGTGKTYTIVKMVLRIIELPDPRDPQRRIHLRNVLLVTYTEKAAGELRSRIREGLEERIAGLLKNPGMAGTGLIRHLQDCLNNMHEALIGTIHAVCLRLLQTFPFESGVQFETSIVDDGEGLEGALRESIRSDWQVESTGIPWALTRLAQGGTRLEEKHFKLVRETAGALLGRDHAVLDRAGCGGLTMLETRSLLEDPAAPYESCETGRDFLAQVQGCLTVMDAICNDPEGMFGEPILAELRRRSELWRSRIATRSIVPGEFRNLKHYDGSKRINTPKTKQHTRFAELAMYHETLPAHQFLAMLSGGTILLALICDAAQMLAQRWSDVKSRDGLVSYGDMLRLMHKAIVSNPSFVTALRTRLRYVIIDEFQDTSAVQWKIFRHIVLDDTQRDGTRLFVVGDPKQSIYAFQGADVHSYLNARAAILDAGGQGYALEENFRSLPQTIQGYNRILTAGADDWFLFDNADLRGLTYTRANAVRGPSARVASPSFAPPVPAVQVMALRGNAVQRRTEMAQDVCGAIQALRGTTISLPRGLGWVDTSLDYEHCAVIVENHAMAPYFLDAFRTAGIPAVKYKMEGVFQSPLATAIHALLRAIVHPDGDPAPRLAALLTPFFNRSADFIDPELDLEPCSRGQGCSGDNACIAHALAEWTTLAGKRAWAQLFRRIQVRTGIRERLMHLDDGERHLADLRQIIDYCIEKLCCANYSLVQLVEHLSRLYTKDENAGQDHNLHVLATQQSSVKVLTMHASKGLEFPVVFVATAASRGVPSGANTLSWIDADSKVHVRPVLSRDDTREAANQRAQERRRLLYVALTRAQALLFVPMHLGSRGADEPDTCSWSQLPLPGKGADKDLTLRLQELLDRHNGDQAVSLYGIPVGSSAVSTPVVPGGVIDTPDPCPSIADLGLAARICRQTSYTQLSRQVTSSREIDRSEEPDADEDADEPVTKKEITSLPGSRQTGDALHCALEELLKMDDANAAIANTDFVKDVVKRYLDRNDVLKSPRVVAENAVVAAAACVQAALSAPIEFSGGERLLGGVAGLERKDRLPEMEFLLETQPHWVHGYMDLVFRVADPGSLLHPWRYYVLDWKSDTLPGYTTRSLASCIVERHYDLQAKLYCHALDRYLAGVLGGSYSAAANLGGALYVFLRGFATPGASWLWTRNASPVEDAAFVTSIVR